MFFELIATITIGVGAAGVAMLARRLSGRRLPGWLTPVAAGAAMIGFVLWAEYSWYGRTVAALPDGVEVASANESRQFYRPWTYVAPLTDRFIAVSPASTNPALPGQRLVSIYLIGRWSPNYSFASVLDCEENRRADLIEGVAMAEDGSVPDGAWRNLPADDPILRTACKEGEG